MVRNTIGNIYDCMGGTTCRITTMCAASAAERFQYFFHSRNLKRRRLSDVRSVRAIRSKSKSLASLQRQARNHSYHVLPCNGDAPIFYHDATLQICYRQRASRRNVPHISAMMLQDRTPLMTLPVQDICPM